MKFKLLLLSTATIILNINIANAADAIIYESPVTYHSFSWTGGYVGGQIGYNWGHLRIDNGMNTASDKSRDLLGGLYAGYNYAFYDTYIIGIEGDINYSTSKSRIHLYGPGRDANIETSTNWEGAIRGRIGIAYNRFMPYLAAGMAVTSIKDNMWDTVGTVTTSYKDNKTLIGWTVGAGLDYAFSDNWLLRAEYRYSGFGNKTIRDTGVRRKYDSQSLRLGVAYKF